MTGEVAKGSGDRQLLMGVMAVQLGMATPAQIISAAGAWAAQRDQDLGALLERMGALDAARRQMLEQMVSLAVAAHAGDAAATLATFGGERVVATTFGGRMEAAASLGGSVVLSPCPAEAGPARVEERRTNASALRVTPEHPGRYLPRPAPDGKAELGRGGIGRVLLAFDEHLGREVALKELLGGAPRSQVAEHLERFLREARVTGQLEHPGIVPVYELGQRPDGTVYYTMRLVRGRTLGRALREAGGLAGRLGLLTHFAALCQAVGYAHSRGVVHRDLKPENVMLGPFGETVVLDWGLAKVRGQADLRQGELREEIHHLQEGSAGHTLEGQAIGTPLTMSPEQAEGRLEAVDERSDVWSLGVILYEILTGGPPFPGESPFEVMGKVLREEVPPVRARSPEAPAELASICEKALSRERGERYADGGELAREVEAYLTGERVGAYAYSTWDLVGRVVRRNKLASGALAGLLLVIAVALGLVTSALGERTAALARADEAFRRERIERQQADTNLARALIGHAMRGLREGSMLNARAFSAGALVHLSGAARGEELASSKVDWVAADARAAAWLSLLGPVPALVVTYPTDVLVTAAVLTPDQKGLLVGDDRGRLRVVDLTSGAEVWRASTGFDQVQLLAIAPDGRRILAARDGIQVWEIGQARPADEIRVPGAEFIRAIALSPDRRHLAIADEEGDVSMLSADGRATRWTRRVSEVWFADMAFDPTSTHLVSSGFSGRVRLFDVRDGTTHVLPVNCGADYGACRIAFSPCGGLGVLEADHRLRVWRLADGVPLGEVDRAAQQRILNQAAGGSPEATDEGREGLAWLLPLLQVKQLETELRVEGASIGFSRYSPLGESMFLLGVREQGSLAHAWRLDRPTAAVRFVAEASVNDLAFSPDGRWLAAASAAQLVLWRWPASEPWLRFRPKQAWGAFAFSPDGARLAVADADEVMLLDLREPERPRDPAGMLAAAEHALGRRLQGVHLRLAGRP